MIKNRTWLVFSLLLLSVCTYSQIEESVTPQKEQQMERERVRERLLFGGEIGLSFGSITYIKLVPLVGYRLTDRLVAGLGPIYIYEKYKEYNFETSMYGGKAFVSFTVFSGADKGDRVGIGNIMIHLENEVVNVEAYDPPYDRLWIDNLLLGGGIYQPLGSRSGISVYLLWDVTQNKYSPYYASNPILKFGFNF